MDFSGTRVSLAGKGLLTGSAASTVTAGVASVSVGGITVSAQVAQGLTLAVGDVVLIGRTGSVWFVFAKLFTAAPAPVDSDPPPPPKPTVTTGTLVVSPVETRSYRSGKWRTDNDDVYQGAAGFGNHTGCVFYGSKPRSLAGATVTKATIRVRRDRGGVFAAQGTTMRLMTQATRPGGAPTLTSTASGPSIAVGKTQSAFVLPTSWVQSMVDGTAGGIAFFDASGSPYVVFAGRSSYGPAFTLTISWKR